jgi:GGDEF domain-containing protein
MVLITEAVEIALLVAAVALALWRPRRLVSVPWSDRSASSESPRQAAISVPEAEAEAADALPDRLDWTERIRTEASRCGRYERSAVVVLIRLDAFDELVAVAAMDRRRLCRAVVASIRRSARGSDVVFGDETGTFRVLLVEADEPGARAYLDRLAGGALRPWMETINTDVRLTAAWASTSELTDLPAADRLAESRLAGAEDGWIRSAFVLRF